MRDVTGGVTIAEVTVQDSSQASTSQCAYATGSPHATGSAHATGFHASGSDATWSANAARSGTSDTGTSSPTDAAAPPCTSHSSTANEPSSEDDATAVW